jgi:hypothetical protein
MWDQTIINVSSWTTQSLDSSWRTVLKHLLLDYISRTTYRDFRVFCLHTTDDRNVSKFSVYPDFQLAQAYQQVSLLLV